MSDAISNMLAKRFIARRDVKAIQHNNGSWAPHTKNGRHDGELIPWTRDDLNAHISGAQTFGHYLLNTDSTVKLFAFDIDLEKTDPNKPERVFHYPKDWGNDPFASEATEDPDFYAPVEFDPRSAWHDRRHPARSWLKYQMKLIAHEFANAITSELDMECAVAYSGGKGVHVYGFTGLMPASEARDGAQIILDSLGHYEPSKGNNFFLDTNDDLFKGFQNFSIEVFPKQDEISAGSYGNLMRMALGRNKKSPDPTFFVDMTAPMGVLAPVDTLHALAGNPWKMVSDGN